MLVRTRGNTSEESEMLWLPRCGTTIMYTGDFVIWYILAAVLALALREAFRVTID
jgi:hypothetical protein